MTLVRKFLRLEGGDRRRLVVAWLMVPAVGVGLRVLGSERVLGVIARSARPGLHSATPDPSRFGQLASLVAAAARYGVFGRNCLRESLVLYWLARRAGLEARLEIGVRKVDGEFEAHAWVETGARPHPASQMHGPDGGAAYFEPFDRSILSNDRW